MAIRIIITVKETEEELKALLRKASLHQRPRIKMLLNIVKGHSSSSALAAATGANTDSIANWKKKYSSGGIDALLCDARGGDFRSGLSEDQKEQIKQKMSSPTNALTSYKEAQTWLKEELEVEKNYHALNKYLKRNFGTKLKVGRKSHVKKDEAAIAVFKKPT
jgi:transposase